MCSLHQTGAPSTMITSKCDITHTIDFDTITCDLPKGHEGAHKYYCGYSLLWEIKHE